MIVTPAHLLALGVRRDLAETWAQPIANACSDARINSPKRMAAFLAQVLHESNHLTRTVENLRYVSAARLCIVWPNHFPTRDSAMFYVRRPEELANLVYADRLGNGDEKSGDGWKYRGRGLLQITGRYGYRLAGVALNLPLEAQPELLEEPPAAALSAAWWWQDHGLSPLADAGDIDAITRHINGPAMAGADERRRLYEQALRVLETAK